MATKTWLKAGLVALLATAASTGLADPEPMGQPQVTPPQQGLPLKIVDRAQFCTRLASVFASYGQQNGYDKVQTTLLATGATVGVVQEFRAGRATDFINTAALAAYSAVPEKAAQGYLPLAGVVATAMGLPGNAALALSAAELRFIPFAQRGIDMVVIAGSSAGLTPERAKKVSEVARANAIHLHMIWVGATDDQALNEAQSLAWLAATTGGGFLNLGGRENPCAPVY